MDKFKKATKKITAVASAALMVSSAAFASGLGDYPSNFVTDGEFNGQVVVGFDAQPVDASAAQSIIDDLASQFSGSSEQVKIMYKKVSGGGTAVSAIDSKEVLNYGDTLGSVAEELDKDVSDILEDGSLDNNDYNQELVLLNGDFDYRIFDEIDGEDEAKSGLYYSANTAYAQYVLDFEDQVEINTTAERADLIGEELVIMGNEFTVVEIEDQKLTLIGGSQKVALGEGESTTQTVDGKSYEISIQSVSTDEVLLTVNGQSQSIDEFDTETVAGVTIAVTDLVDSDRDSVKGYAEIVVGGQKVELTSSRIKINDEDLDDVYEDYDVDVSFDGSNTAIFEGMTITYRVDENTLLDSGNSLVDVLFDSFEVMYMGTNDVEYEEFKLTSSNDGVSFSGKLFDGKDIPSEFELTTDNVDGEDIYLGSNSRRIFFQESDVDITDLITSNSMDAVNFTDSAGNDSAGNTHLAFNISAATSDVADMIVFSRKDDDEFYFYEIKSVDRDDLEVDFEDLLSGNANNAVDWDDVQGTLELKSNVASSNSTFGGNWTLFQFSNLGTSELYLANELTMNFANIETDNLTTVASGNDYVFLEFTYNSDVDMDNVTAEGDSFQVNITRASDVDDALQMKVGGDHDFVNNNGNGDETAEDSDVDVYVDQYGTMVMFDMDNFDVVTIWVPDEEVEGMVDVVFGGEGSMEGSVVVDADMVEDKKEELEDEGYTIVGTETMSSEEVEFDVSAPVLDSDVSGMEDMIVVGGPAVNRVAADLLGKTYPTYGSASGVEMGEAVIRYFESSNSVLVYGYDGDDTAAAAERLNDGGLSGSSVNVQ